MSGLLLFGTVAVTAMLISYWLEDRSHWFVLVFAGACAASSAYGWAADAYPFGVIEAVWALIALRRWSKRRALESGRSGGVNLTEGQASNLAGHLTQTSPGLEGHASNLAGPAQVPRVFGVK
jgi:hypothetical protein